MEAVLQERVVRGKKQYLVRWKGYNSFDDTWEPEENLLNAKDAVAKFQRKGAG